MVKTQVSIELLYVERNVLSNPALDQGILFDGLIKHTIGLVVTLVMVALF